MGAPYWLPDMKAAFVGMTATTGKKELVRATLNSLVYQICDIITEFKELFPDVKSEIHTDGGMIHNKYLMQYLSNISQSKVDISNVSELSALGSAMNAEPKLVAPISSKFYEPRMTKQQATDYRKEWSDYIQKLS